MGRLQTLNAGNVKVDHEVWLIIVGEIGANQNPQQPRTEFIHGILPDSISSRLYSSPFT